MSAQAFIAFLRCEAHQSEERAKSLRATAAAIEAADAESSSRKRRKTSVVSKPRHSHTAYTMFVQENYESIKKKCDPNMTSKDIITIVAKQWVNVTDEEKEVWKERALAHKEGRDDIAKMGLNLEDLDASLEAAGMKVQDIEAADDKGKGKKRKVPKKSTKV